MKTPSLIVITVLTLASTSLAVDPPPDGGYPLQNTAEGEDALFSLTTGEANTAIGYHALFSNTSGNENTAIGRGAISNNTVGYHNTAIGFQALMSNTTGFYNTAVGSDALYNNTGNGNTATGNIALVSNTTGGYNTATGRVALMSNTTGAFNAATGNNALAFNTTGNNNVAAGPDALLSNTTGNDNIALGNNAGENLTTGSNNIDIGNPGIAGESNKIRIGTEGTQSATFVAGISTTPLDHGAALAVGITSDGQLGVRASSARFKEAIKPMDKASEAILSLKPVAFRYKKNADPKGIPQFGLVAEDVAKVAPDLVACDADGKPFTVRYDEVNAMLLNEFLKEHKKVEEQASEIKELKSALQQQESQTQAQLQQLTARLAAKGL